MEGVMGSSALAMLERDRRVSDQLVRLIQLVFGLVIANSLYLYREVLVHPFARGHGVALLALVSVFAMTVLSWIDWHVTMELHPYDRRRPVECLRLAADLAIVVVYAYILFAVEDFVASPAGRIDRYLAGFPVVYALYLLSGGARKYAYGVAASRFLPIVAFFAFFLALWTAYRLDHSPLSAARNVWYLTGTLGGTIGYRLVRAWYRSFLRRRKEQGRRIGIDVDGVLADQVGHILPRINDQFNLALSRESVTDWRLRLPGSDISREINSALADPDYVLTMPPLPGAKRMLNKLFPNHEIIVLTARPEEALDWTQRWLEKHGLSFDRIVRATEARKSVHGCHVLVDDYLGNVREFLQNGNGVAVLVDQPWNRLGREPFQTWIQEGRLAVACELAQVPGLIRRMTSRAGGE
jgi:uncharacterized HAD superfamily protein